MSSHSEAPAKPIPLEAPLRRLGKYELVKQIGAGGMGTVYLAKDAQLKRQVALKILPHEKAKNPTLVRRFLSEAQASAQLRHDHIVAIYENGEIDGHLYIAMEYVDGTDLHELIRKRGKIPIKRSLEIIKQVALALQHAYEHNIVHRDIKPSNLLVRNDGVVKLTDLGLARSVDDTLETDITRAGTTVGTVDYMSPEQGRNSKLADIRSDLYSLGCTWYHMLTGKTPFPEGSMTNKLQAHATKPPPNPHDVNDQVTEGMVAVIHRLMSKKPDDRYQTPAELLRDLARSSMTRGGVAEEVLSAITEEEPTATESQRVKRATTSGALPPKKKSTVDAKEESEGWDWELIRPLAFGTVVLLAIIGLGIVVAGFSGGFNLGGGKVTLPDENLRPHDDGTSVVSSPDRKGQAAAPNAAPAVTPAGVTTVTTPGDFDSGAPGQSAPTSLTGNSGTSTMQSAAGTNPATSGSTKTHSAPPLTGSSRTFDAEAVPAWSIQPSQTSATGSQTTTGTSGTTTKTPKTLTGLPAGASKPTSAAMAQLTVGPGTPSKTHFRSLSEAAAALSREGGVITLQGAGPFALPDISLRQIQRLVLQAGTGSRPVVLVDPADGQSVAGLTLAEGALEVDGIDFAVDRSQFGGSQPIRIIASLDGQLVVRNCSVTVWGTGSAPVEAFSFSSQLEPKGLSPALEPRLLIDQVFVRGDAVTALAISRPNADVVVRNSLFVCGAQPAVEISGVLPEALARSIGDKPRRAIRLIQSTLVSRSNAIRVSADDVQVPPSTHLVLQDTICSAAAPQSRFLDAGGWTLSAPDTAGSKLSQLQVQLKNSRIFGFEKLADLGVKSAFQAINAMDWLILWKKDADTNQFSSTAWPNSLPADLSTAPLTLFASESSPAGLPIGGEIKLLSELTTGSRRWLQALLAKPQMPPSSFTASPVQVVKFDVAKQADFGTFLRLGNWPAGTLIEVSGSGLRPMSPVQLSNKSWKIVGVPGEADGAPLAFTPKAVAGEATSLIRCDGGAIELENLRFQMSASKKTALTSLISASGTRLALDNVSLQGVWNDTDQLENLLVWTDGDLLEESWLVCRDCFFMNGGNAVRITTGQRSAFLSNSLIVSRGQGIQLRISAFPPDAVAGALIAQHLTVASAQGAFHVRGLASDAKQSPFRLFVERCAFPGAWQPRGEERQTATLLELTNPQAGLSQLEWWGLANGVGPDLTSFVRGDSESATTSSEAALSRWMSTWSAEQEQRLLIGPGGLVFTKPDAAASKSGAIKPAYFTLDPSAKAKTWDDGFPIGANISRLDAPQTAAKPKTTGKPATPAPKRPTQADF